MQPQSFYGSSGKPPALPSRQFQLSGIESPVPDAARTSSDVVDHELEEIVAGLTPHQRDKVLRYLGNDESLSNVLWHDEEVLDLCRILLEDLVRVANPRTPLAEFFELLGWVVGDPALDKRPFSLKHCLQVVNGFAYRDSFPDPAFGQFSVETWRQQFKADLKPMWKRIVSHQHPWVRAAIANDLDFVVRNLLINPQWANEQVKRLQSADQSLFEPSGAPTSQPSSCSTVRAIVNALEGATP